MKLVIDISEDVYTRLFDNGIQDNEIAVDDICEMARAIRKGTSLDKVLDKIMDEIEENINYNKKMNYQGIVVGLLLTLDIIDKYTKGEGE